MKAVVCIGGCEYLVEGTYTPFIPGMRYRPCKTEKAATQSQVVEIDSAMQLRELIPGQAESAQIDSVMLVAAIEQGNAVELIADLDLDFLSEVQTAFMVEGRKQIFQNIRDTVERFCANMRNQPIIIDYI